MKYCRRCVLPTTRPNLTLNAEGICNACTAHSSRREIDWVQRERAFREVVRHARERSRGYDCVVPVSGGKDSTWQVVQCLSYGLHPLAVTWKPPSRTAIGARNLANLIDLGVDHIDYQINPKVERKFVLRTLTERGSPAVPMHMALFSIPSKIAARFEVPLVVWGENSAAEYGGTEEEQRGFRLDDQWLRKYGVTDGTTAKDWVSPDLTAEELTAYTGPTAEEFIRTGVLAVFLGYYFPWDPLTSFKAAQAHGFEARAQGPKTGYYNHSDIDDNFISIHHYLKWFKFGFTRTYDNLALEIRNGRITRERAIEILRSRGDETPHEDIDTFCKFLEITPARFFEIAEKFRNREIWVREGARWRIRDFLIPDWAW